MKDTILNFTTKTGKQAEIRYPTMDDVAELTRWVNRLSAENTFVRFSGEVQTEEEEKAYLEKILRNIQNNDSVHLFCFVDGRLAGKCDVNRKLELRAKFKHVAGFSIAVDQDFRNEGIGYKLAETTINEAKAKIAGMRLIVLECFSTNTSALHMYSKLGFKECGRIPQMIYHRGEYVDEVQMCMPLVNP